MGGIPTGILEKYRCSLFASMTKFRPEKLKHAIVTPIYKSGEKNRVENYRPVSVLSTLSKIYEKIMYNRLLTYLNTHEILNKHQYDLDQVIQPIML